MSEVVPLPVVLWISGVTFSLGLIVLSWVTYEIRQLRQKVGDLSRVVGSVERIEHLVGNGSPGVFVRRDELALRVEKADEEHARFEQEIRNHGERLYALERGN